MEREPGVDLRWNFTEGDRGLHARQPDLDLNVAPLKGSAKAPWLLRSLLTSRSGVVVKLLLGRI